MARFQKGNKGGPGRPKGSKTDIRKLLGNAFLDALKEDFDKHGKDAMADAREKNPLGYCQLVASILPKQADVNVTGHHEHTHKSEPVSETAQWLESIAAGDKDGASSDALH